MFKPRPLAKCLRCEAEYQPTGNNQKWCLNCAAVEAKRRFQEYEERHTGPCPKCGLHVTRRARQCKSCGQEVRIKKITGPNNYAWKGGRTTDQYGYVRLLVAPEARKGHRYQAEHILIWERAYGKPLPKGWIVHHINHIKDDNRLENLLAMPRGTHNQRHGEQRIQELEAEIAALRERLANASRDSSPEVSKRS